MTNEAIKLTFKLNGSSISEYDKEAGRDRGMIYTRNRGGDVNLFPSWKMAYDHFVEQNWIR
jgi:hypothetical protein